MQYRTYIAYRACSLVVGIVTCCLATASYAETCKTNIDIVDPATRQVCTSWDAVGDPQLLEDFTVDYLCTGCSDAPEVKFATADDGWELYSEVLVAGVPTGLADLGDVLLASDVSPNNGNFTVKIAKSGGFGAANVSSIVLDSSDQDWTGHSSMASGLSLILGDLGGLTLVERSGSGGVLDQLFVLGDLTGPLTVATLKGGMFSTIGGNVIGAADITIGKIENGSLTIALSLVCSAAACPDITVTDKILNGSLVVGWDVPSGSIITINELEEPNPQVGGATVVDLSDAGEFAGTLDLPLGLANANTLIDMGGVISGVIDLHGGAVHKDAEIAIYIGTTTAEIKNGGTVSGDVYLGQNVQFNDNQYDGTATFASVSSTGEIATQVVEDHPVSCHFGGILNVTEGMAGLIEIVGSLLLGAEINIGSLSGQIEISEDCVGVVSIDGSSTGDIEIEGDLSGSMTVDGDSSGDIQITGDLSGTVTVGGALANGGVGGGRILVAGESTGAIKVGEKTASLTLIQVADGLGTGGTIEINTTEGNFNADGNIRISVVVSHQDPTPPDPFDGCIRIYDRSTFPPVGGNLRGYLTIIGCHATNGTNDDLNICIDGNDNGNVSIVQGGCTNQVGWSCNTCP